MTSTSDFDPSKMDYKAVRRARRRKLLWSAPLVFIVLLIASGLYYPCR